MSSVTAAYDKEAPSVPGVCLWSSRLHISWHSVKIRFLVSSPLHTHSHLAMHIMAIIVFIVLTVSFSGQLVTTRRRFPGTFKNFFYNKQ